MTEEMCKVDVVIGLAHLLCRPEIVHPRSPIDYKSLTDRVTRIHGRGVPVGTQQPSDVYLAEIRSFSDSFILAQRHKYSLSMWEEFRVKLWYNIFGVFIGDITPAAATTPISAEVSKLSDNPQCVLIGKPVVQVNSSNKEGDDDHWSLLSVDLAMFCDPDIDGPYPSGTFGTLVDSFDSDIIIVACVQMHCSHFLHGL